VKPQDDAQGTSEVTGHSKADNDLLPKQGVSSQVEDELELIQDGDGLVVIGNRSTVERFLDSFGLLSSSEPVNPQRLRRVLGLAPGLLQAGSEIVAGSGRYLKLTPEFAEAIKKSGLIPTKTSGISYATLGRPGKVSQWIKVETGPRALATNPAVLNGLAGVIAQFTLQQNLAEITDYLVKMDVKVDDILQKLDSTEVSKMVGAGVSIQEAMTIRERTGGVNETQWSKVSNAPNIIFGTQEYFLDQLNSLATKLESTKVSELAAAGREAKPKVREWLAVLARSFQLLEMMDVLELDRVLVEDPETLNDYHIGLNTARDEQRAKISEITSRLLDRMDHAVGIADDKMFWYRARSVEVFEAAAYVDENVDEFHQLLSIESDTRSWEQKQLEGAMDLGSKAIQKTKEAKSSLLTAGGIGLLALGYARRKLKD
jgi:hypothetical protein